MRIKHFILLALMSITTLACQEANAKVTLIVGYGDHNSEPYAIEQGDRLYNGIIKDIASEVAAELDIDVKFVKTPRKRIERHLGNNTMHLYLIANPQWFSNSHQLQWSDEIFVERDKIVVRADNNEIYNTLDDLKGMTIGAIRGYSYPTLQPFFEQHHFKRYNVSSLQVNFIRLDLNRIDAFVDSEILIDYHQKHLKTPPSFRVLPLDVSQHGIHAALSPQAPITLTQFNQVLAKLKHEGVIAALLKKHKIK
ncbi:ABC transporter substrate-binding protein [Psychrobium sp. 1_MG-2023]|uniref:substrate-binding periplasmic protein n=1 Tax=Psychrobium sp. 1_MG-2023 TaxID=3062624 RepID=UPI000C3221C6|nr:transporter substrate-binding domain-containing protein [Psychrobium sp. 1_MG-2023]MDP2561602.1 transporter substrate-binding domain-containing protein [Psychrobium sp. 1_MG-2023]PKF55622.1 hypothetical protein CW748_12235 [Alteromonadales bacterium alter-6D02]